MRPPRHGRMKIDKAGTAKIRAALAGDKTVKVTINIDAESLRSLKRISQRTGVPYQNLLGRLVKKSVKDRGSTESRLDRLERELKRMKRILVT